MMEMDACGQQIETVLLQDQVDGRTKPIQYFSRTLTRAGQSYDTTERECLVVFYASLVLRQYLELHCFTIVTDQDAFKWFLTYKESKGKLHGDACAS